MLPKTRRLLLRDYPDFFKHSQRFQTPFFRLFILSTTNDSKAVVIVPKTATMTAVKRNKLKRKLREILFPILSKHQGFNLAIVGYEKALSKNTTELQLLIQEKIEKILSSKKI